MACFAWSSMYSKADRKVKLSAIQRDAKKYIEKCTPTRNTVKKRGALKSVQPIDVS